METVFSQSTLPGMNDFFFYILSFKYCKIQLPPASGDDSTFWKVAVKGNGHRGGQGQCWYWQLSLTDVSQIHHALFILPAGDGGDGWVGGGGGRAGYLSPTRLTSETPLWPVSVSASFRLQHIYSLPGGGRGPLDLPSTYLFAVQHLEYTSLIIFCSQRQNREVRGWVMDRKWRTGEKNKAKCPGYFSDFPRSIDVML